MRKKDEELKEKPVIHIPLMFSKVISPTFSNSTKHKHLLYQRAFGFSDKFSFIIRVKQG